MTKSQKTSVLIAIVVLVFFFVLSLITRQWGFLLWSLLPVFIVVMTTFTTKTGKKDTGR